jgi:hypothetical protein
MIRPAQAGFVVSAADFFTRSLVIPAQAGTQGIAKSAARSA